MSSVTLRNLGIGEDYLNDRVVFQLLSDTLSSMEATPHTRSEGREQRGGSVHGLFSGLLS